MAARSFAPLSDLPRYLARLGLDASPPPTLDSLRLLQARHTAAFSFETLSTLLGDAVPLDLPALERKLLQDGRGGYCYELNRVFAALLSQLGFRVRTVAGRVLMDAAEGEQRARTHLVILVELEGAEYLVDVGFGGMVPTAPLRLDQRGPQATGHEPYRLDLREDGYLLSAQVGGEWRPLYLFDLQEQVEIDHVVGNWFVSTHPTSPFRGQLFCARMGEGVRHTLSNTRYALHRVGAPSQRRELADADEVMAVLVEVFGLRLPERPELRAAIAAKFAA